MTNEEAKRIIKSRCYFASILPDTKEALNMAIEALSVEPQEKIGHWIINTDLGYYVSICSCCNWRGHGDTKLIYKPNYCPNCGAKMKGAENE